MIDVDVDDTCPAIRGEENTQAILVKRNIDGNWFLHSRSPSVSDSLQMYRLIARATGE